MTSSRLLISPEIDGPPERPPAPDPSAVAESSPAPSVATPRRASWVPKIFSAARRTSVSFAKLVPFEAPTLSPTKDSMAARLSSEARTASAVACNSGTGHSVKAPSMADDLGGSTPAGAGSSPEAMAMSRREKRPNERAETRGIRRILSTNASPSHRPMRMLTRKVGSLSSSGSSLG